jgi:hypothetical protein
MINRSLIGCQVELKIAEGVPGSRTTSVADFKAMTGLSRVSAISLLELLDGIGVTRRVGDLLLIL